MNNIYLVCGQSYIEGESVTSIIKAFHTRVSAELFAVEMMKDVEYCGFSDYSISGVEVV